MLMSLLKRIFRKTPAENTGWLARAAALQREARFEEAAAVCEARLAREPADADALQALAGVFFAQRRPADGLATLQKAAAVAPHDAMLLATLGRVFAAVGQIDAAAASYRKALALRPGLGQAADELATLLNAKGLYDETEECCRAALAGAGESATRRHALAGALFEQGRVDEAIAELKIALSLDPQAPAVESDLVRALNYVADPDTVWEAHRAWGLRHASPLTAAAGPHTNARDPQRRLRVGYVSPYFRKHAVTFFVEPAIEHRDRDAFDVVLYADVARPDEYSERLRAHGAQWRSTVGVTDADVAAMVREDRIDILVDLSGHTPGQRLLAFARRPAPVQATWMGYPNTTGMDAVDYCITDAHCDPPGMTERLHTERLLRLPESFVAWRPPPDAPDPGTLPALASGRVTFGSFNSCYKLSRITVELWARILHAVPESRLVLFAIPEGRAQDLVRERFAALGIGAARTEFRLRMSLEAFMEAHREVDIALDCFPYHGTTTTCSTLWMGVPLVCLAGAAHVSRVGVSMLSSVGLQHLAVSTHERYVSAACGLARDLDALAAIRGSLRERMRRSPLTDGPACARALERIYRDAWLTWCSSAALQMRG